VAAFARRRKDWAILSMAAIVAGQQLMVLADNPDQLFRYMATALFVGPMLIPLFLARNRQLPQVGTPDSRVQAGPGNGTMGKNA
jgi:hypothetical protein